MESNNEIFKQAKEEIEAICKKYKIILMPIVVHQGNKTFSSIDIVPAAALNQAQPSDQV